MTFSRISSIAENVDLDQLEIAILGQLYTLGNDVLTRSCTHLKVSKEGKTKRNILKEVRDWIESDTSGADDHAIRQFLEAIFEIINTPSSMPALEGDEEETEDEQDVVAAEEERGKVVKVLLDSCQKIPNLRLKVNGPEYENFQI